MRHHLLRDQFQSLQFVYFAGHDDDDDWQPDAFYCSRAQQCAQEDCSACADACWNEARVVSLVRSQLSTTGIHLGDASISKLSDLC